MFQNMLFDFPTHGGVGQFFSPMLPQNIKTLVAKHMFDYLQDIKLLSVDVV